MVLLIYSTFLNSILSLPVLGDKYNFKVAANIETDTHKLEMRLKQVQYGKNTIGYDNYTAAVPL
jgi:hypothetical protein